MKLELIPVVRYWDYNAKEIFSVLEQYKESEVKTIAAWVPWSNLETDRLHVLQKFLKQAWTLGFGVRLGVTPELGIGYASGGVPDELLRDRQNYAQDRLGQTIYACAPPNIHPLVSLLSPAVYQRYGHFLLKLTQEINDVMADGFEGDLDLVITDSFFKHYRSTGLSDSDHGDYSLRHQQFSSYRKEDWTPMLAEKIFLSRAQDFLESRFQKNKRVRVTTQNTFTREASLGRLMEELMASGPNHRELFSQLVQARSSCSVAWFDDLRQVRDRERNFLISSSLVIFGEVWICEEDYRALSPTFRKKMRKLIDEFSQEGAQLSRPAVVLVQNRFAPAQISCQLREKLGTALKFSYSLDDLLDAEKESSRLVVVEEGYKLELPQTMELISLAKKRDCTVVIFRSSLCKEAYHEFHKLKNFRLNHGWIFEVGICAGGGQVLLIEGPENAQLSMDTLGDSLLSVARLEPLCRYDRGESNIFSLAVDWSWTADAIPLGENGLPEVPPEMKTVFFMNPEAEPKKLNLSFTQAVEIHGFKFGGSGSGAETGESATGESFEAELPPLSVIPITVLLEKAAEAEERSESEDGVSSELV